MAASPSQIITMKKKAFASLKTLADRTNHCELNLDLYRLGIFSGDAIDVSNLNSVLAKQLGVILYLTQLKSDGFYLMAELDHLRFPLSLNELPQLIGYVDRLYNTLNVFEECCMLLTVKERPSNKYQKTMKSSTIRTLTEKTID